MKGYVVLPRRFGQTYTTTVRTMDHRLNILVLLVLLLTLSSKSLSEDIFAGRHHHCHQHGHHQKRPKHPHETNPWEAYREYLQVYYPELLQPPSEKQKQQLNGDGLPWFFHLFPHFPFPFWPPFLQPPPPIVETPPVSPPPPPPPQPVQPQPPPLNFTSKDIDRINVALNVQYLQVEFFLHAAYGYGLDKLNLTLGKRKAAPPVGGQKAQLSPKVELVAQELGLESTRHIRAIHDKVEDRAVRRPLLNISKSVWHGFISQAFEQELVPPFDPYANDVNFLLAAYVVPYLGLNTLADSSYQVTGIEARKLVSALLGVEAGQDAVIRTLLFHMLDTKVAPYNFTVAEFTNKISKLRHKLEADKGHFNHGADNLISGNGYSSRTPGQIFQVLYGTGNASQPGAFFPKGANGQIARRFLGRKKHAEIED